jgi:cobalt-precorrin-5B (C1)-methyltransferase
MIEAEVRRVAELYDYKEGLRVTISVPEGVEIAKRTFNPDSESKAEFPYSVQAESWEPMSEQALIDSIKAEMNVLFAAGYRKLIVSPGNYGTAFAQMNLNVRVNNAIQCSNFIGETIDYAAQCGFSELLLIGHIGKFVKLAGGIMNTHSRYADCRMELITAHTALAGADHSLLEKIMQCVTTDDAISLLKDAGCYDSVMHYLIGKIDYYVNQRTYGKLKIETVMFSNQYGILAKTDGADQLLRIIQTEENK